jgi:hypothetical protein
MAAADVADGADAFECALHLGELVEPVTALCGSHNFCRVCLAAHIAARGRAHAPVTCPLCRGPCQASTAALVVNIGLRDAIAARAAAHAAHAPAAAVIPWTALAIERDEDGAPLALGNGAFGTVLAAEYAFMRVAVKVIGTAGRALTPRELVALRREAALQAGLQHENVVRVFGVALDDRNPERPRYGIVLARMHSDLGRVLAAARAEAEAGAEADGGGGGGMAVGASGGAEAALRASLPVRWRLHALHKIAAGLAHLHACRVVHGDLKPGNVMLDAPEHGSGVALTDFGLAHSTDATLSRQGGRTGGGGALGTTRYMAPELLVPVAPSARAPRPTFATDIFAFAVMAWQVLAVAPAPYAHLQSDISVAQAVVAGERPDLARLPAEAPRALAALLELCWHASRAQRPVSGGAMLVALQAAAPDPGALEPPPPALWPRGRVPAAAPAAAPAAPTGAAAGAAGAAGAGAALPPAQSNRAPAPGAWRQSLIIEECPVCRDDDVAGVAMGCGSAAAAGSVPHALCMPCALRLLRAELTPDARLLRCAVCLASAPPAARPVGEAAFAEVAAWSRVPGRAGAAGDLRPMSDGELARFARLVEAQAQAAARAARENALPEGTFVRCPGCGTGVQKPRGHHCHHVSPGTGCAK